MGGGEELALEDIPPSPASANTTAAPGAAAAQPGAHASARAPRPAGATWLTYTGVGGVSAGALSLGLAAYFGTASGASAHSVKYGSGGSMQLEAVAAEKRANKQAGWANLLFGIGGVLAAAGGAMISVDLLCLTP